MCHHLAYNYNKIEATYLVGLGRRILSFRVRLLSVFRNPPNIASCRFLLDSPSRFISNSIFLTQLNLNQEI